MLPTRERALVGRFVPRIGAEVDIDGTLRPPYRSGGGAPHQYPLEFTKQKKWMRRGRAKLSHVPDNWTFEGRLPQHRLLCFRFLLPEPKQRQRVQVLRLHCFPQPLCLRHLLLRHSRLSSNALPPAVLIAIFRPAFEIFRFGHRAFP